MAERMLGHEGPMRQTETWDMPSRKQNFSEVDNARKLFVGGLSPQTNEETLKDFYGQFGVVADAVIVREPNTKRSRGFGFITFAKNYMVDKAQDNRPHNIDGKIVEAKRVLLRSILENPGGNTSVKKIFVGGIKEELTERDMVDYFKQFGNVVSVKLILDKITGKRRGFAYVEFDDYDAVDKAVLQQNHVIKDLTIDVKKSVYKNERVRGSTLRAQAGYRPQQGMPVSFYQQQPQVMNVAPPTLQANYNYWGAPPQPMPQILSGYQQAMTPSGPPLINKWHHAPNGWNAVPTPATAATAAGVAPAMPAETSHLWYPEPCLDLSLQQQAPESFTMGYKSNYDYAAAQNSYRAPLDAVGGANGNDDLEDDTHKVQQQPMRPVEKVFVPKFKRAFGPAAKNFSR